ncbi:uncharacterized protein PSFLO_05487 [Pseudozyma flocculosa]|uniref:Uncharacterized protein n=1 Tax=Pseudozyma flocculosa TaxID=84751 RepID=A0A5C3F8M0_9BASI|nr:uncharacterized protein PSFLO_05487 [Pseudozyma flocculosa]
MATDYERGTAPVSLRSDLSGGLLSQGAEPEAADGADAHAASASLDEGATSSIEPAPTAEALHPNGGSTPSGSRLRGPRLASQPRGLHERARNASGGTSILDREHGVNPMISAHRSPYPSASPYFLTVIPPLKGSLLPLYPTLGGQLWAISREYGLPSIGGLLVYLAEDVEGNLGPQIGDAAWTALWSRYFADDDSAFFSSFGTPNSRSHKRANDASDSALGSNESDLSRSSDLELPRSRNARDGSASNRPSPRLNTKAHLRRDPAAMAADWSPSTRSIAWSGRGSSLANRTNASLSVERMAARLPIVGKIEWIVDEGKASWWDAWAARKAAQSEPPAARAARRSMHLQNISKPSGASRTPIGDPALSESTAAGPSPLESHANSATSPRPSRTSQPPASHREAEPIDLSLLGSDEPAETSQHSARERSARDTPPRDAGPTIPSPSSNGFPRGDTSGPDDVLVKPRSASRPSLPSSATQGYVESSSVRTGSASSSSGSPSSSSGKPVRSDIRQLTPSVGRKSMHSHVSAGDDSYAGYSALLEDGDVHNEDGSVRASDQDPQVHPRSSPSEHYSPLASEGDDDFDRERHDDRSGSTRGQDDVPTFDPKVSLLPDGVDDDAWRDLRHSTFDAQRPSESSLHAATPVQRSPSERAVDAIADREHHNFLLATPNTVRLSQSAIDRHVSMSPQVGMQVDDVHRWIEKTSGSPRSHANGVPIEGDENVLARLPEPIAGHEASAAAAVDDDFELHDDAYPSDVREVVSLWANEVARSSEHLPLIDPPSESHPESHPESPKGAADHDLNRPAETDEERPTSGEGTNGLQVASANPPAVDEGSRQALLSPFALDEAAFAGPRPDLGDLASSPVATAEESPEPSPAAHQAPVLNIQPSQSAGSLAREGDAQALADTQAAPSTPLVGGRPPPLSIETQIQRDGPSASRRSSADISDSLEDMQKALELLTPAHSPNPGAFPSGKRVPSRDSFAFAKTLSASVTPSPRWLSRAKARQSRAEPQSSYVSSDSAFFRGHVSPRPASASAAMIGPRRNDLQVPISASRLAQFNEVIQAEQRSPDRQSAGARASSTMQAPSDAEPLSPLGRQILQRDSKGTQSALEGSPDHRLPLEPTMKPSTSPDQDGRSDASSRRASHAALTHADTRSQPTQNQSSHEDRAEAGTSATGWQQAQGEPEEAQQDQHEALQQRSLGHDEDQSDEGESSIVDHGRNAQRYSGLSSAISAHGNDVASMQSKDDLAPGRPENGTRPAMLEDHDELLGAQGTADAASVPAAVSAATKAIVPEAAIVDTQPLNFARRAPMVTLGDEATDASKRLSVSSEAAATIRRSPAKKDHPLFGPSSLSMYTLRDCDIEALSGDPEQGMASIERFLRGNSFAESSAIPSADNSPGLLLEEGAKQLGSDGPLEPQSLPVSHDAQGSGDDEVAVSNSDAGFAKAKANGAAASERWSQGSQSQSNWTGPSRQSLLSSSYDHDRDPETPLSGQGQLISAAQRHAVDKDANVSDAILTTSPEASDHLFAPRVDPDHGRSADGGPPASIAGTARLVAHSKDGDRHGSGDGADGTHFGTTGLGDCKNEGALDDDEIRQMTESTRAAVREALSFRSSPDPIYLPQSPILRSPTQRAASASPSSPISTGSFTSMSRRRTSSSSLSGRKASAPLSLSLDIDGGGTGKTHAAARRSGSPSPNQRFRTLPPSPRMIPSQFGPSSPLSATFPTAAGATNALGSPTSKLSHSSRFDDLTSLT